MTGSFAAARRLPRRLLLHGAAGLAAMATRPARAGEFPEQAVRYINPFPPGAATDLLSRA